jgi:hypothetical protein
MSHSGRTLRELLAETRSERDDVDDADPDRPTPSPEVNGFRTDCVKVLGQAEQRKLRSSIRRMAVDLKHN